MAGVPEMVGLLHRADWTKLSLSAEVNTGGNPRLQWESREASKPPRVHVELPEPEDSGGFSSQRLTLLIAPGGRYREESATSEFVRGCDGERYWEWRESQPVDPPEVSADCKAPVAELFNPAPLLTGFVLDVRGPVTACGREGVHVVATPRPSLNDPTARRHLALDRIEAIVDTELGILLHRQEMFRDEILNLTQLTSLTLNPPEAADDSRFRPPPGAVIGKSPEEKAREFADRPGSQAGKTAAGLIASGLGAWVRYSPCQPSEPAAAASDPEPDMPSDEPTPADPSPVSDEVLYLLYRSGSEAPDLTATLHEWVDSAALAARINDAARRVGYDWLDRLFDAVGERASVTHLVAKIRTGGYGRYRIDFGSHRSGRARAEAVACDGQRHWALHPDRLRVGPATGPPMGVGYLVDSSWLLECHLSGGAEVTIAGRRAYRISIADGVSPTNMVIFFPAEAVVDAELGVLLRLTCYADGRAVTRWELRDVSTEPTDPGVYRIEAPPGVRTVEETGNLLEDIVADASGPVGSAARTAVDVAKRTGNAVSAARSFLDNLRRQLRSVVDATNRLQYYGNRSIAINRRP